MKFEKRVAAALDAGSIRSGREARGLSQAEFGLLLSVSESAVRSWESGARKPRGPARDAIARVFRNRRIPAAAVALFVAFGAFPAAAQDGGAPPVPVPQAAPAEPGKVPVVVAGLPARGSRFVAMSPAPGVVCWTWVHDGAGLIAPAGCLDLGPKRAKAIVPPAASPKK